MSIKVNWNTLSRVRDEIETDHSLKDEALLTFVIVLADKSTQKKQIKFGDFLQFMWALSESKKVHVTNLVVTDLTGTVLYRFKQTNANLEEVPSGGNPSVIQNWNFLSDTQREAYMKILIAQIESSYDKPS